MIVQEKPSLKGGMVRKFLYLIALSVVTTLAFSSVAMAQYVTGPTGGECSGLEEEASEEGSSEESPLGGFEETLIFVPDANACIDAGGAGAYGPVANTLNKIAADPETGEQLGAVKNLDPDLSSGANSVTYKEFCEDFSESSTPVTAQEYLDGISEAYDEIEGANAQERDLLDPDGDGQACTSEDEAFLVGDTGGGEADDGSQDQYEDESGGQQGGEISELPDTGGPSLLPMIAGLLVGFGLLGLFVAIGRRA